MLNKNILQDANRHGFIEDEIYEAYKIFFGTLVSASRLRIINLLRKGEKSVSGISSELSLPQPSVSHDLARLKKCGFVSVKIIRNYRYYSLNKKTISPLMNLIDRHMESNCMHILHEINGAKDNGK